MNQKPGMFRSWWPWPTLISLIALVFWTCLFLTLCRGAGAITLCAG